MPPLKYLVPNGVTALSLVLGLASITMSVEGNFELAAWMILCGTLLDKLDGTTARLFNATSEFGLQFDSFADFVVFGIAPAALIYFKLVGSAQFEGWYRTAVIVSAGMYVVALAVRLARFNIADGDSSIFYGVPGTLMGAVVAAAYLTWAKYELGEALLAYSPAMLAIGAALMVSSLHMPKLKVRKSLAFNLFQFSNVAAAYVLAPLMLFPEYLCSLAIGYLFVGLAFSRLFPPAPDASDDEDTPQEQLA